MIKNSNHYRKTMMKIWLMSCLVLMLATSMIVVGCGQKTPPGSATTSTTPPISPVSGIPAVMGKQGIDLSSYGKIELSESSIEVSSINELWQGKENLIKGLGDPFWHVKYPKETAEAWVVVDLGSEKRLNVVAIRPRKDQLDQIWNGDTAVLQGSNDKEKWVSQVTLRLYPKGLNSNDWIALILPEKIGSYRYYRLFISDPNFLSLGGLALYGTTSGIPVTK